MDIMTSLLYLSILFLSRKEVFLGNGLITLLDTDWKYAHCLSDYLEAHTGIGFQTTTFTDISDFLNFFRNGHTNILLISEALFNDLSLQRVSYDNLFILSTQSHEHSVIKDNISFEMFFKYQSAECLVHKIMSNITITSSTYKINRLKNLPVITGVYSPIKRCGKTSFSVALAMLYSMSDSALFITFDENANEYLTFNSSDKNLSDLMFYFIEDNSSLCGRLDSVVCSVNGLDIIPPMPFSRDMRSISTESLLGFLSELKNTHYSNIVIDFSNTLTDIFPLLRQCDKIYMPVTDEDISRRKLSSFLNSLKLMDVKNADDLFTLVTPPVFEYRNSVNSYINQIIVSPLSQYINKTILGRSND